MFTGQNFCGCYVKKKTFNNWYKLGGGRILSIGANLKKLRISKKKSLQHVATAANASKAHIWQLENGKSRNPSLELIKRLADYFEVTVASLIGEIQESEDDGLTVMFRDLKKLGERDREILNDMIKSLLARKRQRKNENED